VTQQTLKQKRCKAFLGGRFKRSSWVKNERVCERERDRRRDQFRNAYNLLFEIHFFISFFDSIHSSNHANKFPFYYSNHAADIISWEKKH
jgi:hypothetical protein